MLGHIYFKQGNSNKSESNFLFPKSNLNCFPAGRVIIVSNTLTLYVFRYCPESNWDTRICNPMLCLSATAPPMIIPYITQNIKIKLNEKHIKHQRCITTLGKFRNEILPTINNFELALVLRCSGFSV